MGSPLVIFVWVDLGQMGSFLDEKTFLERQQTPLFFDFCVGWKIFPDQQSICCPNHLGPRSLFNETTFFEIATKQFVDWKIFHN
mmetsp:Transcript_108181/g.186755  ORF Transcript_108181/g.186755 Transcript_108181/m.186755 type:complete len:84 (-) Transcript_108181:207-458(-)